MFYFRVIVNEAVWFNAIVNGSERILKPAYISERLSIELLFIESSLCFYPRYTELRRAVREYSDSESVNTYVAHSNTITFAP